mmetsp:Transcript_25920/g.41733  ORF Transcript_25920/g.41733 Transcript_25920/m.41733 type:complete len:132 (-) Transcript_25920:667-1062(-)
MPLKRSKSSRSVSLSCLFKDQEQPQSFAPRKRNSLSRDENNNNLSQTSSIESFGGEQLESKNPKPVPSVRLLKRARRQRCEEEDDKFYKCAGCKQRRLTSGFFMYLDRCFCSEGCRNEAITMDEIQFLQLT